MVLCVQPGWPTQGARTSHPVCPHSHVQHPGGQATFIPQGRGGQLGRKPGRGRTQTKGGSQSWNSQPTVARLVTPSKWPVKFRAHLTLFEATITSPSATEWGHRPTAGEPMNKEPARISLSSMVDTGAQSVQAKGAVTSCGGDPKPLCFLCPSKHELPAPPANSSRLSRPKPCQAGNNQ